MYCIRLIPVPVEATDGVVPKPVTVVVGAFAPKVKGAEVVVVALKVKPPVFSAVLLLPAPNAKIGVAVFVGADEVVDTNGTEEKPPFSPIEILFE